MKTAISEEVIRIREMQGAEILDSVSCAYISERFFKRSRAWFTQRLNNNTVNGKPVSFNPNELLTLRTALKVIASELTHNSAIDLRNRHAESLQLGLILTGGFGHSPLVVEPYNTLAT